MQISVKQIVTALGGEQLIKRSIRHELDLLEIVREGLPMESVAHLQKNMGFTNKTMSHILAISESTYQRRIRSGTKLSQDETEKAISLSEVFETGKELFKKPEDFRFWLESKNYALGGEKPMDLLDSALGRAQILEILGRMKYGIYS